MQSQLAFFSTLHPLVGVIEFRASYSSVNLLELSSLILTVVVFKALHSWAQPSSQARTALVWSLSL